MNVRVKDPGSAITHFIGMMMAMLASTPLLIKAARQPEKIHTIVLGIFISSMILLYGASTLYHTLDLSEKMNKLLKKNDIITITGTDISHNGSGIGKTDAPNRRQHLRHWCAC